MNKKLLWELVRYVFFGVLTTLVNIVVYFAAGRVLGAGLYLVANVIAWVIAVAFAYVTNKLWVFDSKSWERHVILKEGAAFVSARVFSLVVEEIGLFVMIDALKFDAWSVVILGRALGGDAIAKLAMQFVVIVLNYVFSKLVIFKRKKGA